MRLSFLHLGWDVILFTSVSFISVFDVYPRRLFIYKDYTCSSTNHTGGLNAKGICSNAVGVTQSKNQLQTGNLMCWGKNCFANLPACWIEQPDTLSPDISSLRWNITEVYPGKQQLSVGSICHSLVRQVLIIYVWVFCRVGNNLYLLLRCSICTLS